MRALLLPLSSYRLERVASDARAKTMIVVQWPYGGGATFISNRRKIVLGERKPDIVERPCKAGCGRPTKNMVYCCRHCNNSNRREITEKEFRLCNRPQCLKLTQNKAYCSIGCSNKHRKNRSKIKGIPNKKRQA